MNTNSKTRKISAAFAACTILAGMLFYLSFPRGNTANAAAGPELISALPAGAPALFFLDLAAVRSSSFYERRPDKSPIAIPSPEYAQFVQATGFDFEKDLDRVAIASWPAASPKAQRQAVFIAEGRFNRAKIAEYAKSKGTIERQQGRDVYHFAAADRAPAESMTFLDDHRLAFVAGPSIDPLFAGHAAGAAPDPARERAARVDGAAAFFVMAVPPIPPDAGNAQSAQFLALARSVQWITLAARPEGDDLRVSLEGECDTPSNAEALKSMLEILRSIGRGALESPNAAKSMTPAGTAMAQSLLTTAEVTQSAERVRILFNVTPEIYKLSQEQKSQVH